MFELCIYLKISYCSDCYREPCDIIIDHQSHTRIRLQKSFHHVCMYVHVCVYASLLDTFVFPFDLLLCSCGAAVFSH